MRSYDLKGLVILGTVALSLLLGTIPAQAVPIEVNFTAEHFSLAPNPSPSILPPSDPVMGTIIYEAVSVTADIDFLISINLIIDGHQYSISEVGYISPFSTLKQLIGGDLEGFDLVDSIAVGKDDFRLDWYKYTVTQPNPRFSYTSSSHGGIWDSNTFSSFSVRESTSVPEPATLLLLGSGLIAFAGVRRKIKK